MRLSERFALIRPLEEMELALVRGAIENPALVDAHEEAVLRTALALARLYKVRADGREIGVMSLLDEYGLKPKLMVGTSIGAVLALFRSRLPRFDQDEIVNIVRTLSWRKLFRAISTEHRYGLPAALRLFLRAGIGRWFGTDEKAGAIKLSQLPIKTIITVSGIRKGKLPHPVEF